METAGFEMRCHYLIGFIALAWHRASLYPDFQMVAHFDAVNSHRFKKYFFSPGHDVLLSCWLFHQECSRDGPRSSA